MKSNMIEVSMFYAPNIRGKGLPTPGSSKQNCKSYVGRSGREQDGPLSARLFDTTKPKSINFVVSQWKKDERAAYCQYGGAR